MKQQRRRTMRSGVAISILFALMATACGGSGSGSGSGSDGDDNASTGDDRDTTTTIEEATTTTEGTTDTTEATSDTTIAETGTTLPGGTPTTSGPSGATTTTVRNTPTTKKPGSATTTTAKPTATTIDQGPPKTVVGQVVAPGAPIKIGVTYSSGNEPITGDITQAYQIAFDVLRKKGELPVHGREIVVASRTYPFNSPNVAAAARGACTALVQDDKVFAALTWAGPADCLAENKIPAIGGALTSELMQQVWPYAFSFQWDTSKDMRNGPPWAESLGLLKGKKLGLVWTTATGRQKLIDDNFKPELRKLGYTLTEDVATSDTTISSDAASQRVAVQRLKAAGVDTVFLQSAQPGEFAKTARAQGYKPKWIISTPQTALICDGCPARVGMEAELFDGTYALSWRRIGENGLTGNPPPTAAGVECAENFEKFSGERTRQNGTASEQQKWQSVQWTCDGAKTVVAALKAAGPNLTQGAFINALETTIKGQIQSGLHFDYVFGRNDHYGGNSVKTLQLDGSCLCWRTRSAPRAPYVS